MKLMILGSQGFIGKTLVEIFQSKYTVVPITRDNLNLLNYNEVNYWLKCNEPDVIVNCATNGVLTATDLTQINYKDIQNNVNLFLNFYNSKYVKKFINVGSGAEFDRSHDLNNIEEKEILNVVPYDSYSYSKNLISRMILERENFYTLRLFGCFGKFENQKRLFKSLFNRKEINVIDKKFDYTSLTDYSKIVEHYIIHKDLPKDINCVYEKKYLLSDIIKKVKYIHNLNIDINIEKKLNINYTGDFTQLKKLNINLEFLDTGIEKYFT